MREAVNGLRELGGSAPIYSGLDLDVPSVRTQVIAAAHLTSLMNNLNAARTASSVGLSSVGFQVVPTAGALIDDTQMANLRTAVK